MIPGGGKVWFTAAELANLALPGLPKAVRKIRERATGWALLTNDRGEPMARPRTGARGGGLEYHIDVIPPAARTALAARGIAAVAHVSDVPETHVAARWRWFDAQSDKAKSEAKRRAGVIALVESHESAGMTRSAAVAAAAVRSGVGGSTLWGWIALVEGVAAADRLPFLAPRRGGGGAEAAVDERAWQVLVSDYLRPEKPVFSACVERARDYAASIGVTLPSEQTLRRHLVRNVDGRLIVAKRMGREAVKKMVPHQQRSVADLHAMHTVNIDGHKWDVKCVWPDGTVARPMMVTIQDVYSRKVLAHRIGESESALETRMVFADLFANYGIPKKCVLDNSRAFSSAMIAGNTKRWRFKKAVDEPTGLLPLLGVELIFATPHHGQAKPIERAFGDLENYLGTHPAFAGAYTGKSPTTKPDNYDAAVVPIDVFRAVIDAGIARHNARIGRRTEMASGRSFDAVFAASYAASDIGKASPERLRLALLTAEERPCDRSSGVVTLNDNRYYHPDLHDYRGKKMMLRFDPDRLHGSVHVYDRHGQYICEAECIAPVGFLDKAGAKAVAKQRAELRRMVREAELQADLIDAATLAAMLPEPAAPAPVPSPTVLRMVRPRGRTAAAVKTQAVADPAPLNPVIDRLGAVLRLVGE